MTGTVPPENPHPLAVHSGKRKANVPLSWGRYLPVLLLFSAGIVVSGLGFEFALETEQRETEADFRNAARERVSVLTKAFEINALLLESLRSLYLSSDASTRYDFKEIVKPFSERLRGVRALEWVPRVKDADRDTYETAMRRQGLVDFEIRERDAGNRMIQALRRDEYYPIVDTSPSQDSASVVGFDLGSNRTRRTTIELARDSGETLATARITLLRERESQFGFQLFLPVYSASSPIATVEGRRENLEGFILGVFRFPDLVEGALSNLQPRGVDLFLTDESAPKGEQELYFHLSRLRGAEGLSTVFRAPALEHERTLDIGGRRWMVRCVATPLFMAQHRTDYPALIFLGGFLFTMLLCTYVLTSINRNTALAATNTDLHEEIDLRWRAEDELKHYRDHLEELVQDRTRELEAAQAELIQKERLAVLGRMTATVAHEMRNPLGTVRNAVFSITDALDNDDIERIKRAASLAERNIRRCDGIITELMDFTRKRELMPIVTDIDAFLAGVLDEYIFPDGIDCMRELNSDIHLAVDHEHLRRAVVNVVTNAVQALQEEGAKGNGLTVETRNTGKRLEICFTDTGPGIPDDIQDKIFEPLFSTRGFGIGLGIPIISDIMKDHGGGIEYESRAGQGTTATLWLPMPDLEK